MLKLFAVRDVKADAFGAVVGMPTKGLASRGFLEACQDPKSPMAQYPDDYSLYLIGEYDPATGSVKGLAVPELVVTASEVLASVKRGQVEEVAA